MIKISFFIEWKFREFRKYLTIEIPIGNSLKKLIVIIIILQYDTFKQKNFIPSWVYENRTIFKTKFCTFKLQSESTNIANCKFKAIDIIFDINFVLYNNIPLFIFPNIIVGEDK